MRLQHARLSLELHELSARQGPALLLLHALYGSASDCIEMAATWTGPVYALDFCGHGRSDWLLAGGYTPELFVGDADCALARIGAASVVGAGVGAYVALLLAGARPHLISATLLLPGAGLAGGGTLPDFANPRARFTEFPTQDHRARSGTDPLVATLERDVRPPDYVEPFARAARRLLLVEDVATPPPWWQTAHASPNAEIVRPDLHAGLARLAVMARDT